MLGRGGRGSGLFGGGARVGRGKARRMGCCLEVPLELLDVTRETGGERSVSGVPGDIGGDVEVSERIVGATDECFVSSLSAGATVVL